MSTTDEQFADSLLVQGQEEETEEETPSETEDETPEADPEQPEDEDETAEEWSEDEDDEDDEDAEEDAEEEDEEEPADSYTVKVDGEEQQVTLDELKRGYSGQTAINKGLREVAEERKRVQGEAQQIDQVGQALMQMYQRVQEQGFAAPPQPPSSDLLSSDPIGYIEAKDHYEQQLQAYQQQQHEMQQLDAWRQQQAQQQMRQKLEEEARKLTERIPDLADPEKGAEIKRKLARVGAEVYGFSEEELGGITDARAVQVLFDAMRYRQLEEETPKAARKAEKARALKPKSAKKGRSRRDRDELMKQAKGTGSVEDWAKLL